ncbi:hypothetical protein HOT99_gp123 [Caulobacter phage CcrBL10]|uniref:Uncharacterized protein n=1 Tax=Caulobacter phage CcrBL10 TaxID=2283269 RepID=A0A385E9H0_9CAUD|nr:hypothetical protein HOT99_gp123 [Caulobacter phage CcrBL10]AXQ68494.1 hypothetical protein CcrBL10_gp290 [Caulobacter phage CcrBL10]
MKLHTPIEILTTAAALIERNGWGQGKDVETSPRGVGCPTCANLALGDAARQPHGVLGPNYRPYLQAQVALLKYLKIDIGLVLLGQTVHGSLIVNWNDAPERTAAEVVAALRGAANALMVETLATEAAHA